MTHYLSHDPFMVPPMDDLTDAWDELLNVLPDGWEAGRPAWNERRQEWSLYAWDGSERAKVGHRSREWTAVHPTQAGAVRSMAQCMAEIRQGRVPK